MLAAGGLGTPQILQNSGIHCSNTLFVDPVLCVAAPYPGAKQDRQMLMPFISQQDGYILSPYMDYLSLFFDKNWQLPPDGILSLMIKIADEEVGGYQQGKRIPENLYVADATLFPKPIGNPPILTIMALASKTAKTINRKFGI